MNPKGEIVINQATHKRLGAPVACQVLFDRVNNCIGLRPTSPQFRNSYPITPAGKHGGQRIRAFRLLTEHSLAIKDTLEFPDAEIDEDGILVLNLRTARISNRALNHPARRRRKGE
jgi:hypothetical protein